MRSRRCSDRTVHRTTRKNKTHNYSHTAFDDAIIASVSPTVAPSPDYRPEAVAFTHALLGAGTDVFRIVHIHVALANQFRAAPLKYYVQ